MYELQKMLQAHNWSYMYADESEYRKGLQERKAIDRKVQELIKQGISRNAISLVWCSVDKGQAA